MIKQLNKKLLKTYDYQLDEYKILKPDNPKKNRNLIFFAIFAVFIFLHLLQLLEVYNFHLNFIFDFIMFAVFVVYPLSKQEFYRKEVFVVTPKFFIKRDSRKEYSIINIDKIDCFDFSEEGIKVCQQDTTIILDFKRYKDCFEVIIDILEAKGKTFDKKKDYMIRPIKIRVIDNKIVIEEIKQEETSTQTITGKLSDRYKMLTPGFIKEIIPKNAIIEKPYFKENTLYLEMSHLEVGEEHTENVGFSSINVEDCIMVFEDVKIIELFEKPTNDRNSKFDALELNKELMVEKIAKAVVSEWKYKNNEVDFIFAVGVGACKVKFKYSEVLIGWNIIK